MTSAAFTLTGAAGSLLKLQTTVTTSVVATLDSLDGVRSVAWSIKGSDETGGTYTLTPSGTFGAVCTTTSKAAGTAFILQCKINGGVDGNGTLVPAYTTTAKVWVPATGTGLEVGCVGEDDESDPTYGWTGIMNSAVRNVASGGVTSVTGTPPIVSSGGATPAISITAATTVAAGSLSASDKTKLDDATSAATASKLTLRGSSAEAAYGYVKTGTGSPSYATAGDVRAGDNFSIYSRNAADSANRSVVAIDDAGAMTVGNASLTELTISSGGTLSCVSGAAATFGCTAGACVIATADDASTATLSAGTAGNAVSVACSSAGDAITCTVNATASLALSTTAATLGVPLVTWTEGLAPTVQQVIRTGDAAANALILASQTPSTTSTGANRDAKRVRIQIPAPQGAGAESYVGVEISGTERAQIGRYSAVFNDGNSGKAVRIGAHYPAGSPGTSYAAIYFGAGATSPNSTTYGFLGDNSDTYLNAPTGTLYMMKAGAVHTTLTEAGSAYTITLGPSVSMLLTAAATTAAITANKAQALTISIGTQTTDTAPKDLTLTPGQPWASATSTNRKPGDLVRALGSPSNSGTTHAAVRTTRGSTSLRLEDKGEVTTTVATATVVYTYTLADNTGVSLRARMISFRTDSGTNCNVNVLEAAAKRRGGGATIVGTPTTVLQEDAAFTSYTATVSGNDLRVEVQARGAETWKHRVHVEIIAEEIT